MKTSLRFVIALVATILFVPSLGGLSVQAKPTLEKRTLHLPESFYGKKQGRTQPILQNLTTEDIGLTGLIDSVEHYYYVPMNNVGKDSYLQLNVRYSNLLLAGSTVTIYIDQVPVMSTALDEKKTKKSVKVPLEGDTLKQGFHHVEVAFYGSISSHECANIDNPANWFTLLSSSHILLNVGEEKERKDPLQDYPYPFVQNHEKNPVQTTIVIPNDPSSKVLLAALKVANYLSAEALNENIPIVTEANLGNVSTHLIAIGTEAQWEGKLKQLFRTAKVQVKTDEITISNYFMQMAEERKQLLFVTAPDEDTIDEKITVLTEERFISQLTGSEVSIANVETEEVSKRRMTWSFSELDIPDITLTGRKNSSQHFFYYLPSYVDVYGDATLHLKVKLAETLFTRNEREQRAELVVFVNDEPHSIAVDDLEKEEGTSTYAVPLPIAAEVLQQSPFLKLQFVAKGIREHLICVPPNDDKWMFIKEDSSLQFPLLTSGNEVDFRTWPAPFITSDRVGETLIVMPDERDDHFIGQLQQVTNSLGSGAQLDELKLVFAKDVDEVMLKSHHVILLGDLSAHPYLEEHAGDLLLQYDREGNVDVSPYQFLNETAMFVTWVQPSVWNNTKGLAVFSAIRPSEREQFVSPSLVSFVKTTGLKASIVVENRNGDIFTNELHKLPPSEDEERRIDFAISDRQTWLFFGVFFALVVSGIAILIYVYRRARKKDEDH